MIESLAIYLLVASLCFGLGYACGTHSTWLPALGGKIRTGVGGIFSRKVVAPSTASEAFEHANDANARLEEIASNVRAASGGLWIPSKDPPQAPPTVTSTTSSEPFFWMQPPGDKK